MTTSKPKELVPTSDKVFYLAFALLAMFLIGQKHTSPAPLSIATQVQAKSKTVQLRKETLKSIKNGEKYISITSVAETGGLFHSEEEGLAFLDKQIEALIKEMDKHGYEPVTLSTTDSKSNGSSFATLTILFKKVGN